MIHISLSPNLEADDTIEALKQLLVFWKWDETLAQERLGHAFLDYFNNENTHLFNSGRSALYILLKSLELEEGDEVIMQAFTCNAVANPIIWAGGKPVYADIDKTFNIDPAKLSEKITSRTKAVIIQHTFGIPAKLDDILDIARKNNLVIIEDCAHALGATYDGKKLGTFGDAAIFSFGRDKVISSVYGGMAMINNNDLLNGFTKEYSNLRRPGKIWTIQQLLHPVITPIVLETYSWLGKYMLYIAQRGQLLSYAVTKEERKGKMPGYFPAVLPEPLAALALNQFEKLNKLNIHRKVLAKKYEEALKDHPDFQIPENYDEGAVFLRYPIMHERAWDILHHAKEEGIILGDWYKEVIAPEGTDKLKINYNGSCYNAEGAAPRMINLPTNIRTSEKDADRIINFLLRYK